MTRGVEDEFFYLVPATRGRREGRNFDELCKTDVEGLGRSAQSSLRPRLARVSLERKV